ncbi:hypothetical protein [Rosistilla ulvae]|nr:hypothetical protein [Rosistilla ulvae]
MDEVESLVPDAKRSTSVVMHWQSQWHSSPVQVSGYPTHRQSQCHP